VILAVALAGGLDARRAGTRAEGEFDFATAVAAYDECVATGEDRDRRYCQGRLDLLMPQAADGFSGWTVLERARRSEPTPGDDWPERVQAAIDANPSGPAAEALATWLAHRALRSGSPVESGEPWVREQVAMRERRERHRSIGLAGLGVVSIYAARAAWGPGDLAVRGALLAAGLLGLAPGLLAAAYDPEHGRGFVLSGAVLGCCVLLSPRAPPVLAGLGTLGALLWTASVNGWLASMGVP